MLQNRERAFRFRSVDIKEASEALALSKRANRWYFSQ